MMGEERPASAYPEAVEIEELRRELADARVDRRAAREDLRHQKRLKERHVAHVEQLSDRLTIHKWALGIIAALILPLAFAVASLGGYSPLTAGVSIFCVFVSMALAGLARWW